MEMKREQERRGLEIRTGEKDKMLSEQTGGALGEKVLFVLFCELSNVTDSRKEPAGWDGTAGVNSGGEGTET